MHIPNDDAFKKWLDEHPHVEVTDNGSGRRMGKRTTDATPVEHRAKTPAVPKLERAKLKKGDPVPTEHQEQVALLNALAQHKQAHPCLELLFAIPNGGKLPFTRTKTGKIVSKQRILLVAEGMRSGVPDLFLPVARGRHHGLFIEMKRSDHSRKATQEQKWWIQRLEAEGYKCVVCYGAEEAFDQVMQYVMGVK